MNKSPFVVVVMHCTPKCLFIRSQRPLNFGIDIVLESVTKYLNGHSDVVMGALATNREDLYKKLLRIQIGEN